MTKVLGWYQGCRCHPCGPVPRSSLPPSSPEPERDLRLTWTRVGSHLPRPPFCPVLFRTCAQTGLSPRPPPAGGTGVMHRQPCRSHVPLREPQRPQCRRAARPRLTPQVLGCGEGEIKEEKATPRCGARGLLLTLGPHLGP